MLKVRIRNILVSLICVISDDLQTILPDVKSFSPTNLKYMRYFYEMYSDLVICPQIGDDLIVDENRPQTGDELKKYLVFHGGTIKLFLINARGIRIKRYFIFERQLKITGQEMFY